MVPFQLGNVAVVGIAVPTGKQTVHVPLAEPVRRLTSPFPYRNLRDHDAKRLGDAVLRRLRGPVNRI